MPAFQRAIDLGYISLETDIHATRDGVLLAFHDDDLSRTCGRKGLISELDYEDVSQARVNGTESIPLLDDLLTAWPQAHINIDCKSDQALEPLVSRLALGDIFERVCIGSFSDKRLSVLRQRFGSYLCTSMGPREVTKLRLGSWIRHTADFQNVNAAQVPVSQGPVTIVDRTFISAAHKADIQVHVWTIDEPEEMKRLLDLGVDGIMTDRPAVLKDVLLERNCWHGH